MSKRILYFFGGVIIFFAFVFFSYLVHKDIFVRFDFDMTVRLQDNIGRRVDDIFSAFSDIGKFEIMLILLILLFVVAGKFIAGLVSLLLFFGFHLLELFGKFFVEHAPPPHFFLRTKTIFDFPQFHVRSDNSYPSGHAGRTMFISIILLVLIWQSKVFGNFVKVILSTLVVAFDIVMLVSRVYLGEHWTSDVVGGAILGVSLGLVNSAVLAKRNS